VLDGYAAHSAANGFSAQAAQRGHELIGTGERAYREHNYAVMISADVAFHRLIVEESGNPLLVESTGVIWRNVQRTMSEVLYRGGAPSWIWEEHAAILDAQEADDVPRAGDLARRHAEHGERLILDSMAAT